MMPELGTTPDSSLVPARRPGLTDEEWADLVAWDWPAIREVEQFWHGRIWAMPRCSICRRPMAMGQTDAHKICLEQGPAL